VPSNELVAQIHNRMPAILEPKSYDRWLGLESDPRDLLITYSPEPMTMWPISTGMRSPDLADAFLLTFACNERRKERYRKPEPRRHSAWAA